jgi:hypothetical protein
VHSVPSKLLHYLNTFQVLNTQRIIPADAFAITPFIKLLACHPAGLSDSSLILPVPFSLFTR